MIIVLIIGRAPAVLYYAMYCTELYFTVLYCTITRYSPSWEDAGLYLSCRSANTEYPDKAREDGYILDIRCEYHCTVSVMYQYCSVLYTLQDQILSGHQMWVTLAIDY